MSERSKDLELYRERFLNQLHSSQPALTGHQEFLRYWRLVEREAKETEELGKLEEWVRGLARDKDRVRALRQKLENQQGGEAAAGTLLALVRQILMILEDVEKKIRKRRDKKRGIMAWLLFKAGPGVKKKIKPGAGDVGKSDDKATDTTQVSEAVMSKPKPKAAEKPKKKMAR